VVPRKLLRSSAFRLALGYAALFAGSAVVLLLFVYFSTSRYMLRQADETIEAEIVGLADRYRLTGLAGLTSSIRERLDRRPQGSSIYLVIDSFGTPIVGNLNRWPTTEPDDDGFLQLELAPAGDEPAHIARAKTFVLVGGFRLLVGRDLHELQSMRSLLLRALAWGLALTVALAVLGGLVASRSRIRRIAAVREVVANVMAGDLSRRIPQEAASDDIEDLIANLNQMLDELEKLVEGVRRVSEGIAHDLRTPLARLKTRLEKLRRAHPDEEIGEAIDEADRLLATFAALLRIARIESRVRARESFPPVDLTALVDDVAELYRPLIEEKGKTFVVHNAPSVALSADRDMLFQAVANLLDNALKHTPPGGRIELSLSANDRGASIVVADDGPGIPADEREKVRERFYRLDPSRGTPGSGLGLSLVEAVVELHRGELRLEDNHPGLRAVVMVPRTAP
jgi:signal transduction histidine kinase